MLTPEEIAAWLVTTLRLLHVAVPSRRAALAPLGQAAASLAAELLAAPLRIHRRREVLAGLATTVDLLYAEVGERGALGVALVAAHRVLREAETREKGPWLVSHLQVCAEREWAKREVPKRDLMRRARAWFRRGEVAMRVGRAG